MCFININNSFGDQINLLAKDKKPLDNEKIGRNDRLGSRNDQLSSRNDHLEGRNDQLEGWND